MGWKCSVCDTYNEEGSSACYVCGAARPAEEPKKRVKTGERTPEKTRVKSEESPPKITRVKSEEKPPVIRKAKPAEEPTEYVKKKRPDFSSVSVKKETEAPKPPEPPKKEPPEPPKAEPEKTTESESDDVDVTFREVYLYFAQKLVFVVLIAPFAIALICRILSKAFPLSGSILLAALLEQALAAGFAICTVSFSFWIGMSHYDPSVGRFVGDPKEDSRNALLAEYTMKKMFLPKLLPFLLLGLSCLFRSGATLQIALNRASLSLALIAVSWIAVFVFICIRVGGSYTLSVVKENRKRMGRLGIKLLLTAVVAILILVLLITKLGVDPFMLSRYCNTAGNLVRNLTGA